MWKLTGQMIISPDVNSFFAVMHLPLVPIGEAYILSFDKLVYMQNHKRKAQCLPYGNRDRNFHALH